MNEYIKNPSCNKCANENCNASSEYVPTKETIINAQLIDSQTQTMECKNFQQKS